MSLIVIANNITPDLVRKDGTADYEVEVSVNRRKFIWRGPITNHVRANGAAELLRDIAGAIDEHRQEFALSQEIKNTEAVRKALESPEPISQAVNSKSVIRRKQMQKRDGYDPL